MNSIEKLISLANVRGSLNLRCQFEGDWAREHEQEPLGKAPYSLLFAALPSYLVIPTACGPLSALVEMLRSEAEGQEICSSFMLDALSQALFTLVLRAHLTSDGHTTGSLAFLNDKRLCRAWQAMLADPPFEWTIECLAELASMSRATFVRTFVRIAGAAPWALLTQVRMELAINLLRLSHLGLSDIAVSVGYQSQSAFSKKFKEFYGEAPGKVPREI